MSLVLVTQFSSFANFSQAGSRINSISATKVTEPASYGTNSISKTNITHDAAPVDEDKPDIVKDMPKPFNPQDVGESDK